METVLVNHLRVTRPVSFTDRPGFLQALVVIVEHLAPFVGYPPKSGTNALLPTKIALSRVSAWALACRLIDAIVITRLQKSLVSL